MNWLETIINGFVDGMDWIVNAVFAFVNPTILRLFALSFLILNISKFCEKDHRKTRLIILIIYCLYTILKIAPIKDWVLEFDIVEFVSVLPFFCMVLLPKVLADTPVGKILLDYKSIAIYYCVFNAIWLSLYPYDGSLTVCLIFALALYVIAQFGGFWSEE